MGTYLVPRPARAAAATIEKLRALGHHGIASAAIEIVETNDPFPVSDKRFKAIAVTSTAAIDVVQSRPEFSALKHLPVFTVGDASARAAKTAGFATITNADGDAAALAKLLSEKGAAKVSPLLYCAAQLRAFDLQAALQAANIKTTLWEIYEHKSVNQLTNEAETALNDGKMDGVLITSPNIAKRVSAMLLASRSPKQLEDIRFFAISKNAASALDHRFQRNCTIAKHPNEDALLDLLPKVKS